MGSMFSKIRAEKLEASEEFKIIYLRHIVAERPDSYYVCIDAENGNTLALGTIDTLKEQLDTEYTTRSVKRFRHDPITDTVKVWM